jgi:hypothetical protein
MSMCFEAALPAGRLRLALPGDAADAVAAALALAQHEGLVAALESALQQPLDPRPVASFGAEPPAEAVLWADAGDGVRVGLPWSAVSAMGTPPDWPLRWPQLAFDVEVATFAQCPLPDGAGAGIARCALPHGAAEGVLLLPPAFQAPWRVLLHDADHGLGIDAEWRGPGGQIVCHAAPEPAVGARPPWRVLLAERIERPLAQWLGWEAAPPLTAGAAAALVGPPVARGITRVATFASNGPTAATAPAPAALAAPPAPMDLIALAELDAPAPPVLDAAPRRFAGRIAPALDGAGLWI